MNPNEIWRDIPEYVGFYQASNQGNIRSCEREIVTSNGRRWIQPGKVLSADDNHKGGYLAVQLSRSGIAKRFLVHRLVAITFIGNEQGLSEVNHKNGVKTQNHVDNLEWSDRKWNIEHAVQNHLIDNKGEKNQMAKLTASEIINIRDLAESGLSNSEIASKTRATKRNVRNIVSRTSWKHLT